MCVICVTMYYGPSDPGYWVTAVTFPLFKSLGNLTLPTEGEVEESRISCSVIIELVPIKRYCISHQKGLPPILEFLVPLFCDMWVSCPTFQDPAPRYLFPSLCFCLTASLAPPLLCPCCWPLVCKPAISHWWFSPQGRLSARTNLWFFPTKPTKCYT